MVAAPRSPIIDCCATYYAPGSNTISPKHSQYPLARGGDAVLNVAITDLITGIAVISLASAAIGAVMEYCWHEIRDNHR